MDKELLNYTNHSQERLMLRYGLEPSDYIANLLTEDYEVDNIDIIGSETRIANIKYVAKDNNIITFLPTPQPKDSFFYVLVNLRKDIEILTKKITGHTKTISNQDKKIYKLTEDKGRLEKENEQVLWDNKELIRELNDVKRQLKESKHYAKELKKKLNKKEEAKLGAVEIVTPPQPKEQINPKKKKYTVEINIWLLIFIVSLGFILL
jgi:hypothetical protein